MVIEQQHRMLHHCHYIATVRIADLLSDDGSIPGLMQEDDSDEEAPTFSSTVLSSTTFGLPKPKHISSEIGYEELKYDSNMKQKEFLDRFKDLLHIVQTTEEHHEPVLMFVTGSGGTGKSKVATYVRSEGCTCKVSVATNLAASIYSDATTIHTLAKIPVVEECD